MDPADTYKLERYETAFRDYQNSTEKFHEAVLALAAEGRATRVSLAALTYELDVKHRYFIECASRLAGLL